MSDKGKEMPGAEWAAGRVFNLIHRNSLVYNACWEDPRLDREALQLGPDDTVLVITSGGCNALDYALARPKHVYAVDLNPRQNALLELKLAGIRGLDFETFFAMFGHGRLPDAAKVYRQKLRSRLSQRSRQYWDRRINVFDHPRRSFYFSGACGLFARMINAYVDRVARVRPWVDALLEAKSLQQQRRIYRQHVHDRIWTRSIRFFLRRRATLGLVGVPPSQWRQVETQYEGGILKFIEDCLDAVFARLPLSDNYFWRVSITGSYSPECCPEYLKPGNFQQLKDGLAERVSAHTDSVQGFLERHRGPISRFVLLDHMDWLCGRRFPLLEAEWQAIVNRAAPAARLIWRSAATRTEFVDRARVRIDGRVRRVGDLLNYHGEWAAELHRKCRAHLYGSFHIADLVASAPPAPTGPPGLLSQLGQSASLANRQDARPVTFSPSARP